MTEQFTSLEQLPDWTQKMAGGLRPHQIDRLLHACNRMGAYFGIPIATERKEPLPHEFTEAFKALGGVDLSGLEVPMRVIEYVRRSCERATNDKRGVASICMNNFALNTSPSTRSGAFIEARKTGMPLHLYSRITNHPNIAAQTWSDFYDDFESAMRRHGLEERYLTKLTPDGSHIPGETNLVIAPAFFDLASRGWDLHFLAG